MNRWKGQWLQLRNPHFYAMALADALLFALALYLAYLFRFDGRPSRFYLRQFQQILPWIVPIKLCVQLLFGGYLGMWRFTGLRETVRLAQASAASLAAIVTVLTFWDRFAQYPRSVFVLDSILGFLLAAGLRVSIRLYWARRETGRLFRPGFRFWADAGARKKALVIGAGSAGAALVQDMQLRKAATHEIVRVLDDDPRKIGRTLHGVPITGPIARLETAIAKTGADEALIAISAATGEQIRRIVELCEKANIPFRILPGIGELVDGRVTVQALREVDFQDLLGRDPVNLDAGEIARALNDRVCLVTGAGGSIGSELCRQILRYAPRRLILMDACEANLYGIEMEFLHRRRFEKYDAVLGRVQDRRLLRHVFERYRPAVVFHAAAYKHVPLLEQCPAEAILNNVIGTRVAMEEAVTAGIERFVLVSSDKAVAPTNVMGASKRLAEMLILAQKPGAVKFMAVRFGNVIGSSGSVLPLFHEQIRRGGPVTVTHRDIVRYFMTIPEAAQLILQACTLGSGSDIFVLDMGKPVRIYDMACDLIRLAGKEPDRDVAVEIVGLRPGEKMREELWTPNETVAKTAHAKISRLRQDAPPAMRSLNKGIERLERAAEERDAKAIRALLAALVPDYVPGDGLL